MPESYFYKHKITKFRLPQELKRNLYNLKCIDWYKKMPKIPQKNIAQQLITCIVRLKLILISISKVTKIVLKSMLQLNVSRISNKKYQDMSFFCYLFILSKKILLMIVCYVKL